MEFGKAIKKIRIERGLNQKELAELIPLSKTALCQIEKNIADPHKKTITRICEIFNIPVSYLYFMSISEEDIPKEKQLAFELLREPLEKLLLMDVSKYK